MAGDWIKMRCNLWDDPRVAMVCEMTDSAEATVIGAMYWLWATADQHSEDGILPGLTLKSIDRKTGVKGFGGAMVSIGWLADHPEGVRIVRFDEHNGSSAKKRCQTAKRQADFRANNAPVTQAALPDEHSCVSTALPRERVREREREDKVNTVSSSEQCTDIIAREAESPPLLAPDSPPPSQAGIVCRQLRQAGVQSVNPSHPKLLALLAAGMTGEELTGLATEPSARGKGFGWLLAAAEGRRRDAAAIANLPPARASPRRGNDSRSEDRKRTSAALTGRQIDETESHDRNCRIIDITPTASLAAAMG